MALIGSLCFVPLAACQTTKTLQAATPEKPKAVDVAGFEPWLAGFKKDAQKEGVSRKTLDLAFQGIKLNEEVLERNAYQPEFTLPIWEYLASAASDKRVENGRRLLAEHGPLLSRVAERYQVQPEYLVAIWGLESDYGRAYGKFNIIEALATLAYTGRRQRYGREQLITALRILDRGYIKSEQMVGSWAGAMGHTQFIPTSYLQYAVDYDADGRRDLWQSLPDVFGSTANYLARSGWKVNQSWGAEVTVPNDFDWSLAEPGVRKTLAQWRQLGVSRADGAALPDYQTRSALLAPAGHNGPVFLVYANFDAIKRYNNSTSYAVAVGHLADRVSGQGPLVQTWPVGQRPLSRDDRFELQRLLTARGHALGEIDGIFGPRTRAAVRAFQREINVPVDGYANGELLELLRKAEAPRPGASKPGASTL